MDAEAHTLEVEGLTKRLGGRVVADRVSLRVAPGEVVGLLGPNGAGKTTVFQLIMGILPARSGRVLLGGQRLDRLPTHQRARLGLGYLPQQPSAFMGLTVADNLRSVVLLAGGGDHPPDWQELLRDFGLFQLRHQRAGTLSGGERRRLELARMLVRSFSVVLLDEPFKGLDPLATADLIQAIHRLSREGVGVLLTDHAVEQTLSTCHRAYIMIDGRVVVSGTSLEVSRDPEARLGFFGTGHEAGPPRQPTLGGRKG
jgi:lipopolysaccharide export system ATP-binding protein